MTLADGRSLPGRLHSMDVQSDVALVEVDSEEKLPVVEVGACVGGVRA